MLLMHSGPLGRSLVIDFSPGGLVCGLYLRVVRIACARTLGKFAIQIQTAKIQLAIYGPASLADRYLKIRPLYCRRTRNQEQQSHLLSLFRSQNFNESRHSKETTSNGASQVCASLSVLPTG